MPLSCARPSPARRALRGARAAGRMPPVCGVSAHTLFLSMYANSSTGEAPIMRDFLFRCASLFFIVTLPAFILTINIAAFRKTNLLSAAVSLIALAASIWSGFSIRKKRARDESREESREERMEENPADERPSSAARAGTTEESPTEERPSSTARVRAVATEESPTEERPSSTARVRAVATEESPSGTAKNPPHRNAKRAGSTGKGKAPPRRGGKRTPAR